MHNVWHIVGNLCMGDRTFLEYLDKNLIFMHKQLCIREFLGCNCKVAVQIKCLSQDSSYVAHGRIVGPGEGGRSSPASLLGSRLDTRSKERLCSWA